MPELPEVEVTRLSFCQLIRDAQVVAVRLGKPLRWPLGCEPSNLVGCLVLAVGRRGKYLLVKLDSGTLLMHLGMSGSLRFSSELPAPGAHDHFDLVTTKGVLRLNDPRRFGAVVFVPDLADPTAKKLLGSLGMEPLADEFEVGRFLVELRQRGTNIKQVLLVGNIVVGVGNIYASEVLFMSGIRPTVNASSLSKPRVLRLHAAIRDVLTRAVNRGGSTLRDFSNAHGQAGYFQLDAMVYGRTAEPCKVCGAAIKMIRQGQRSTFYCPVCQKR
jgi:formamidopyrimidine-DNA glycosylase